MTVKVQLYQFNREPDGFYVTKPSGAGCHNYRGHCPECYSTDFDLKNYSASFQDGYCARCGMYVRMYDAG